MKTLYLMRHGETLFNVRKKIQGWCDSPLTDLGREQAEAAGAYFRAQGIHFDHAYSSSVERAAETLEIATGGTMPYTRLRSLKEWHFGDYEGHDIYLLPPRPYLDFFKRYGGEGQEEMRERFSRAVAEIMAKEGHERVLIVSHGAVIVHFFKFWAEHSKAVMPKIVQNCTVFRYAYEDGIFSCEEVVETWKP